MKTGLILEDLPDLQRWHESVLQEVYPGIHCHKAASVAAALALIGQHSFDIALIDLGLPDGSGVEVIQALRQRHEQTLCVVVTIFDDNEHLFPALKAGAQGYLLKDQTRAQFTQRLRNIAAGEPPLSPAISRKLLLHFEGLPLQVEPESKLTDREQEVLLLISKGLTLPRVALLLEISRNTTAGYVKAIYRKLNISSRAEAVLEASKFGLLG
jgi:DNA-binding NarL/FixJ family response regulator